MTYREATMTHEQSRLDREARVRWAAHRSPFAIQGILAALYNDAELFHATVAAVMAFEPDRLAPIVRAWLADGEYDRLYWAIAKLRGREGGSTAEDERDARQLLDILDPRP